ncbi:MAG: C40 family peptidase [Gammaproteobacteria bacterium]|nr:C40 family peptidase [Gammaproteobacteria bacterium]MBU0771591.1 C40 family peptidase [Gammaproteobacteria bacterium]MBU0857760.1 C40 family peptidase [Gammaproteobacteria bacterium]MBU1845323.1 C40 family peptidase [Gammaproteobacteria bacterium]
MNASSRRRGAAALVAGLVLGLAGCSGTPPRERTPPSVPSSAQVSLNDNGQAQEAAIYALALLDSHYRFGGRNPDSGLDCSGMVSWIYEQVAGLQLPHNAAQIAGVSRPIGRDALQPGDLVFFNTSGKAHSHMGIYAGDGRFIHAPSTRAKYVRADDLDQGWFSKRISGMRTLRRPN